MLARVSAHTGRLFCLKAKRGESEREEKDHEKSEKSLRIITRANEGSM